MGFNTPVLILNDALEELKARPEEFIAKLCKEADELTYPNALGVQSISVGNHCNPVQVLRKGHSSETRLLVSYGNLMLEISRPELESLSDTDLKVYQKYLHKAQNVVAYSGEQLRYEIKRREKLKPR